MELRPAFYRRDFFIFLFAMAASLLLSDWLALHSELVNPDGICYLMSAEKMAQDGLRAAMDLCGQANWPFYSLLIYGVVKAFHLSYPVAAGVLNSFFSALSVVFFILIIKQLGASKRVLWLAVGVILLSHQFNSVREYIIRDHGFWAFYLISILCLLRYFASPNMLTAIFFNASLMAAALFRIEGIVFLMLVPHVAWFQRHYSFRQRLKCFFSLNLLTLFAAALLCAWFLLHPQDSLAKFGRMSEILTQIQQGFSFIVDRYQHTKEALALHVLNVDSAKQAGLVLTIVLGVWYVVSVIGNLSWPYALLALYGFLTKACKWSAAATTVIYGYLLVNVVITLTFLLERLFLSKRYLIGLSLVLMIFVPFGLNKLLSYWSKATGKLIISLTLVAIFISSIGGLVDFGYSKSYIVDAGSWIEKNVPKKASLYANDYQLMYYSKHFEDDIFTKVKQFVAESRAKNQTFQQYDYVALRLGKRDQKDSNLTGAKKDIVLLKKFNNKRGDRVVIYKVERSGG